VYFYPRWYAI